MLNKFAKLLDIEIMHEYYKSAISRDFDIALTDLCRGKLKDYRLIFKGTNRGFSLFYEVQPNGGNGDHPLVPMEEDVKFSFILKPKTPFLLNYSDLPLDSGLDQIFYFHNLNNNKQYNSERVADELLLTSDSNQPYVCDMDRIYLRPQFFNYTAESSNSAEELKVVDGLGNMIVSQTVLVNEGVLNYPVDLRYSEPGKYTLLISDEPRLVFYADNGLIGKGGGFGIIDIFKNDSVPADYRFIDPGYAVVQKTYTLRVQKRKTFWKYYVVLKNDPDYLPENLLITNTVLPVSFERKDIVNLSDEAKAVPFISTSELSIQEETIKDIQLKKTTGNGGEIIEIENLPNASVRHITPSPLDDKIYSEIYIYI